MIWHDGDHLSELRSRCSLRKADLAVVVRHAFDDARRICRQEAVAGEVGGHVLGQRLRAGVDHDLAGRGIADDRRGDRHRHAVRRAGAKKDLLPIADQVRARPKLGHRRSGCLHGRGGRAGTENGRLDAGGRAHRLGRGRERRHFVRGCTADRIRSGVAVATVRERADDLDVLSTRRRGREVTCLIPASRPCGRSRGRSRSADQAMAASTHWSPRPALVLGCRIDADGHAQVR